MKLAASGVVALLAAVPAHATTIGTFTREQEEQMTALLYLCGAVLIAMVATLFLLPPALRSKYKKSPRAIFAITLAIELAGAAVIAALLNLIIDVGS